MSTSTASARSDGLEEHEAGQVHHREPHPVALDDRVPAARAALRVVRRPDDPLLTVEVPVDLPVTVRMVAERDRVSAHVQQLASRLLGDPNAAGRVLAVHDHEIGLVGVADSRQQRGERSPADAAHHVADE
jgi:hypothetical protein